MVKSKITNTLLQTIITGIQEMKGKEIVSLDFTPVANSVCNYFIICNGDSNTHVNAIANSVDEYTKNKLNVSAWHIEGRENSHWVILDFADIVVHIFQTQYRQYYNLEDLWADCKLQLHTDY
jgi:ribosome-associated protein